jgi:glycosidase
LRALWEKTRNDRPQGARFIRFTENHDFANDTTTNRVEKMWGSKGAAAMLAVNFTLDGVPFLYNGQEVADTAPQSIYARWPVAWAAGDTPAGKARFAFCQKLCALRSDERALTQGSVNWLDNDAPDAVLSYVRTLGSEQILTVVNLAGRPVNVQVTMPKTSAASFRTLLAEGAKDENMKFALDGYGFFVGKR